MGAMVYNIQEITEEIEDLTCGYYYIARDISFQISLSNENLPSQHQHMSEGSLRQYKGNLAFVKEPL